MVIKKIQKGFFKYTINYQWVDLKEISQQAAFAVVASEDQRFFEHWGIDVTAITKAFKRNQKSRKRLGGSTLTQQTAKNLFCWPSRTYFRKAVEGYFSLLLETVWGKRRILETYLNIVELGPDVFGVEEASHHYFGHGAKSLTREEAALLAAILPNPIRYDAHSPSDYIRQRQTQIVWQMQMLECRSEVKKLFKLSGEKGR